MSLVYRASWADAGDDRPGIDPCRRVFEQWALEGTGATAVEGERRCSSTGRTVVGGAR